MKRLGIALVLFAAVFATAAFADGGSSQTLDVVGYVPDICTVQSSASLTSLASSTADLGNVTEFCNDARGYEVYIDYPSGISGAAVVVDGSTIPLSPTGTTLISSSGTAARHVRHVTLDTSGSSKAIDSVSLRIVAL